MSVRGLAALLGYVGSIFAANWFVGHVGTTCAPDGPCLIPLGFGITAPSGVLWVGAALFLRDLVQETLGRRWAVAGIVAGAALSYAVATPGIALASGAAFLLSEAADFLVYTPLRAAERRVAAVFASGVVGSLVDSVLFLFIAFRSLEFLAGQFIGKTEVTAICALVVWVLGLPGRSAVRQRAV